MKLSIRPSFMTLFIILFAIVIIVISASVGYRYGNASHPTISPTPIITHHATVSTLKPRSLTTLPDLRPAKMASTPTPTPTPIPTQKPQPVLICNDTNPSCYYQGQATGTPCYDKNGNVLNGWYYTAMGNGYCVYDGANP